jgi:hypothetical protein
MTYAEQKMTGLSCALMGGPPAPGVSYGLISYTTLKAVP